MCWSKEMPGRNLGLRIKYLTITRKADQHLCGAPVSQIRVHRRRAQRIAKSRVKGPR
jgi:hypothetical protein